jgi:hypothetical protein
MLQLHPNNPFRPANWRFERARIMRETKTRGRGRRTDDQWVHRAYKFQSGLAKCKDDVDRYELMEEFPDLYGAYLIYQRGENEDRHPMRYAVEARLLAGQNNYDIAGRLGVESGLIEAYEKIFFNVREKLNNPDYIMTCVLGPSIHAGLSDRDYDLLWKLFGYIYGPLALDAFIHATTRKYRPENLTEVDTALAEDTRSSLQRKVAIVARTYTVNPFSQSELLNIYARLLEMEKDTGGEKNRDVILQNVQVMLDKLPFKVGGGAADQPILVEHYDSGGVELHTDELIAASVGKDVANRDELETIKYPEPQHVKSNK